MRCNVLSANIEEVFSSEEMPSSPLLKQTFAVSGVLLTFFSCGTFLGYPAILLPKLLAKDSEVPIDSEQATWIASVRGLTVIATTIFIPQLMQKKGRKLAYLVAIVPTAISWIVFFLANGFPAMIFGALLQGITFGGCACVGPIAIGEFSCPSYRGVFHTMMMIFASLGIVFVHILGTYLHWRTVAAISEISIVAALCVTLLWKESPFWLARQGQFGECAESFHWYRGYSKEATTELNALIAEQRARILEELKKPITKLSLIVKIKGIWEQIRRRDFQWPCAVILVSCSFFDLSGRGVLVAYSITILKEMKQSESAAYLITIIMDSLSLVGLLVCCVISKYLNRRIHLFTSAALAALFLSLTALSQYLQSNNMMSVDYAWVSATLLTCFVLCMSLGATPVPMGLLGEMFPLAHKGLGSSVAGIFISSMQLVVTKTAPFLTKKLGVDGQFLMHAVIIIGSVIILYFIQPETKGKTLLEIEGFYNKEKHSHKQTYDVCTRTNEKLLRGHERDEEYYVTPT